MSQLLINDYLKQLDIIRRVSGSQRETIVREAFKDLLKNWGKQHNLIEVTARMPWWVGAALAFVSYFVLRAACHCNATTAGHGNGRADAAPGKQFWGCSSYAQTKCRGTRELAS